MACDTRVASGLGFVLMILKTNRRLGGSTNVGVDKSDLGDDNITIWCTGK